LPETIVVCPLSDLPPGTMRLVEHEDLEIGVFNCAGTVFAIEDRCSHDDGPLVEGEMDEADCTVECPRHGSRFDLATGKPLTLPAYAPVDTFAVRVEGDLITLEVD
jgi:3-phenylpropionate/trans-cinnamate dioxygenase ferredoxin component